MNPVVSIIVPVYNAEKTVARCIESILNQEYTDFEVLLMDDGSKDGSGAICDAYAAKDARVRVVHKENTGVSDTRNQALDLARGEYLQFLDSDDWITQDATKSLVRAAQEYDCDLVISDFYRVVGERVSSKGDIDEDTLLTREEFAAHMMEKPADFYYGVLWNKLYRREIVERYRLRMNPDISWCEDFMFNLEYIRYAERFYALQVPIYYYVKTKGSLANQYLSISRTIQMKLMVFEYYNRFYKTVLDEEEYEKCRLKVYRFLIDAAGDGMVPPVARKLGQERISVPPQTVVGEGLLLDTYLERKLLDTYLEPMALKNDLSMPEVRVLLYLGEASYWQGRQRDLAEVTGLTRSSLMLALQHLAARGLVQLDAVPDSEEKQGGHNLRVLCAPKAETVLEDLSMAKSDYQQMRTVGFTGEELAEYARLTGKIRANVQRALQ